MQMFDPLSNDYQLVKSKTDSVAPALEPVAYLYVNGEHRGVRLHKCTEMSLPTNTIEQGLITTDQAKAYADARVQEALEGRLSKGCMNLCNNLAAPSSGSNQKGNEMKKITVDWSKFPDWVKAVAMDRDQEWCAFSCTPIQGTTFWYPSDEVHQTYADVADLTEEIQKAIQVDSSSEPLDWRDSLVFRPTNLELETDKNYEPVNAVDQGLITTYQAEAYADARVREALEEAAEIADSMNAFSVYDAIRALIPK